MSGERSMDCWLNYLDVMGDDTDVCAFLDAMKVPAAVLATHDAVGHPELFGGRSFAAHVPPPPPSVTTRIVEALGERDHEVDAAWAKQYWGCESDVVEDGLLRHSPNGGQRIMFFTYGGAPTAWCRAAAEESYRRGCDVLLLLVAHRATGDVPDEAVLVECGGGGVGVLRDEHAVGVDDTYALLAHENVAWDGLTMGPFDGAPYIPYMLYPQ